MKAVLCVMHNVCPDYCEKHYKKETGYAENMYAQCNP